MPPRRTSTRSRRAAVATKPTTTPAITEAELAEAFDLFAVPRHTVPTLSFSDDEDDGQHGTAPRRRRADDEDEDPDELVLKVADVRRALAAVDLPRPPPDFFDEGERCVGREHFVMLGVTLAETAAHDPADGESQDEDDADDGAFVGDDDDQMPGAEGGGGGFIVEDEDEDEDEEMAGGFERPKRSAPSPSTPKTSTTKNKGKGKAAAKLSPATAKATKRKRGRGVAIDEAQQKEEIDHAFALFTHGRSTSQADGSAVITMADLRRVARELREDVDEQTLKAMLEEAGAEGGKGGQGMAVGREAFESVMKRAGVFG